MIHIMRKDRVREIGYLRNVQTDLRLNIAEMDLEEGLPGQQDRQGRGAVHRKLKNGFVMTILEFETMNGQMQGLRRNAKP